MKSNFLRSLNASFSLRSKEKPLEKVAGAQIGLRKIGAI